MSMFTVLQPLVLASASPRRSALLAGLGLEVKACPAACDETTRPGELPENYVCRVAQDKASHVGARFPESWILAADTAVILGKQILGKPGSEAAAVAMLLDLAGRMHHVYTGFALYRHEAGVSAVNYCRTTVYFTDFDDRYAMAYARTGEPFDKAGGYGIQGIGGVLVRAIDGSYSNVVGLPLAEVVAMLLQYEVIGAS